MELSRSPSSPPSRPFEIDRTGKGYRYLLPHRDLGALRNFGWGGIGFGCLVMAFMIFWMSGPAIEGFRMLQNGQMAGWFPIAFASTGLIGFTFGAMAFAGGLTVLRNRLQCEVEIRGDFLYSTELLGWFRWKRKTKITEIECLRLRSASKMGSTSGEAPLLLPLDDMMAICAVRATSDRQQDFMVAPGYPRLVLESLGEELARQLNKEIGIQPLSKSDGGKLDFKSIVLKDETQEDEKRVVQPDESNIEVVELKDALDGTTAFHIPAVGFRGTGVPILTLLGGGWTAISAFLFFTIAIDLGAGQVGPLAWIQQLIVPALSVLVGVILLLVARNLAIRSAMIGIQDGLLFFERKSLFGSKWTEFEVSNIQRITLGPSGVEVNEEPVFELQIYDGENKKHGLLSRLTTGELRWLAQELNDRLGLDPVTRSESLVQLAAGSSEWPDPPSQSQVRRELDGPSQEFVVDGKSKFWIGLTAGITVACFIATAGVWFAGMNLGELPVILSVFSFVGFGAAWIHWRIFGKGDRLRLEKDQMVVFKTGKSEAIAAILPRDEITGFQMTETGWEINGQKLRQLTITSKSKKTRALFGCKESDIAYIVAHLRAWQGGNGKQSGARNPVRDSRDRPRSEFFGSD